MPCCFVLDIALPCPVPRHCALHVNALPCILLPLLTCHAVPPLHLRAMLWPACLCPAGQLLPGLLALHLAFPCYPARAYTAAQVGKHDPDAQVCRIFLRCTALVQVCPELGQDARVGAGTMGRHHHD